MDEKSDEITAAEQTAAGPIAENLTDDFTAVYANNFHFELSSWDFKIILGQLTQVSGRPNVEWHTAVTMPWGAAKLLRYLLSLNIAIYEAGSGPIKLQPSAIPPLMVAPSGEDDTEQNRAFYKLAVRLHNELTGEGPKP
jgi:hypothetical protein